MRRFWLKLTNLLRPKRAEAELSREVAAHLAVLEDEFRRRGMSSEEARFAATRAFGGVEQAKELHRDARSFGSITDLERDFRYALRGLRKSPGFTTVAVLTLALGIGANTAMFAVVNALLFKSLPFHDPELLMLVHLLAPDPERGAGVQHENVWSYPKYRAFLGLQQIFESTALFAGRDFALAGELHAERVRGEVVTDRYPALLGIEPVLGRAFTQEEAHQPGAQPVALLSDSLWKRRYGGDRSIVGRAIPINSILHTVVGILPVGFRGMTGNADVWVPLAVIDPWQIPAKSSYSHSYSFVARRHATITEESAMNASRVYGAQLDGMFPNRFPDRDRPWGASATSLHASRADADVQRASFLLLGAMGCVLLIACVNMTNLLLVKTIGRKREVGVRLAIGASRLRIVRQFLVEGLMLAIAGGIVGVAMATLLLHSGALLLPEADVFFRTPIAPGVPRVTGAAGLTRVGAAMIEFDANTLLFTLVVAAIVGTLISLIPAIQASSLRPLDSMKVGGGAGTSRGFYGVGTRAALVVGQISIALVLLSGAGLMIKSASRLHRTDIGVNAENLVTARVDLPAFTYTPEKGALFFDQLVERIRAIPGVQSVGLGSCAPVSGGCSNTTLSLPRRDNRSAGNEPLVGVYWATPDYFRALGIQLLRGRNFTDQDRVGRPKVVVISDSAARALWPNDTPLGKVIAVGQGGFHEGAEVIGVVSNVRYRTIEAEPRFDVYIPVAQSYQSRMRLFARSRLDPSSIIAAMQRELRTIDANVPLVEVKTMKERIGDAMWRTRLAAWLFTAFASLALLLTTIGIFGVMSQTVSQRTPEIGVRMALGAQGRDVFKLMLSRAAVLALAGTAIGLLLALGVTQLLTTLLYGVEANDAWTLGSVAILLGTVSVIAGYLPARRAARVVPLVALRYE